MVSLTVFITIFFIFIIIVVIIHILIVDVKSMCTPSTEEELQNIFQGQNNNKEILFPRCQHKICWILLKMAALKTEINDENEDDRENEIEIEDDIGGDNSEIAKKKKKKKKKKKPGELKIRKKIAAMFNIFHFR